MNKKELENKIKDLENTFNLKLKELDKKFNYYMNVLTKDCLEDLKIYEENLLKTNNIKKINKIKKTIKQIRIKMLKKQKIKEIKYFREIHEITINYISEDEKLKLDKEMISLKEYKKNILFRILNCDAEFKKNIKNMKKKYKEMIKKL